MCIIISLTLSFSSSLFFFSSISSSAFASSATKLTESEMKKVCEATALHDNYRHELYYFDGFCFQYYPTAKRSWDDASDICQKQTALTHQADLAIIDSGNITKFLINTLSHYSGAYIWIGAKKTKDRKADKGAGFHWIGSGSVHGPEGAAAYTNWYIGQPKSRLPSLFHSNIRCIAMNVKRAMQWYDYDCSETKTFICQYRALPLDKKSSDISGILSKIMIISGIALGVLIVLFIIYKCVKGALSRRRNKRRRDEGETQVGTGSAGADIPLRSIERTDNEENTEILIAAAASSSHPPGLGNRAIISSDTGAAMGYSSSPGQELYPNINDDAPPKYDELFSISKAGQPDPGGPPPYSTAPHQGESSSMATPASSPEPSAPPPPPTNVPDA